MFPTLKLFDRILCPDIKTNNNCSRKFNCPFNHELIATTTTPTVIKPDQNSNRKRNHESINIHHTSDTNIITTNKVETKNLISTKDQVLKAIDKEVATKKEITKVDSVRPINDGQPPRIQITKCSTVHTFPSIRQKLLDSIYQEFIKLYQIEFKLNEKVAKSIAHRDSLKEELECLQRSSRSTYRNTIISSIVKIKKRCRDAKQDLRLVRSHQSFTSTENLSQLVQNSLTGSNSEYDQFQSNLINPPNPPEREDPTQDPEQDNQNLDLKKDLQIDFQGLDLKNFSG